MHYHITVQGHLAAEWTAWFGGLTVTREPTGDTLLVGPIEDQAALHSVLRKMRDLGLPLLSVVQVTADSIEDTSPDRKITQTGEIS